MTESISLTRFVKILILIPGLLNDSNSDKSFVLFVAGKSKENFSREIATSVSNLPMISHKLTGFMFLKR